MQGLTTMQFIFAVFAGVIILILLLQGSSRYLHKNESFTKQLLKAVSLFLQVISIILIIVSILFYYLPILKHVPNSISWAPNLAGFADIVIGAVYAELRNLHGFIIRGRAFLRPNFDPDFSPNLLPLLFLFLALFIRFELQNKLHHVALKTFCIAAWYLTISILVLATVVGDLLQWGFGEVLLALLILGSLMSLTFLAPSMLYAFFKILALLMKYLLGSWRYLELMITKGLHKIYNFGTWFVGFLNRRIAIPSKKLYLSLDKIADDFCKWVDIQLANEHL